MGYCNHPFVTQTNEALNQANSAPKSVYYSSSTSLNTRVALVIGTHNIGHLPFFTTYFESLGLDVGPSLAQFLEQKQSKKEAKRKYQWLPSTKMKRSQQQQKNREEVYKERIDTSYDAGVGLMAGIQKKRRVEKDKGNSTEERCKCGSNSHRQTTHQNCLLRQQKGPPPPIPTLGTTQHQPGPPPHIPTLGTTQHQPGPPPHIPILATTQLGPPLVTTPSPAAPQPNPHKNQRTT
jgi:hypothetical protein